jgi:HEAT repeat protein
LGRIGMTEAQAAEAAPVLGKLVHCPDGWSRPDAAWALSRMGKAAEPAMPDLFRALGKQRFSTTGNHAARTLANIGAPAVTGLTKALTGGDDLARANAARALGWIGPAAEGAVPVLVGQLKKDTSGAVRGRITLALVKIAPKSGEVAAALAGALSDGFLDVRVSTAMALGKCGPAAGSAIPALEKALADKRTEVKRAAALALGRIGKASLPVLTNALTGDDPFVRKYAARALSEIGKDAVPVLTKALSDSDAEVRREAVWSLMLIAPKHANLQKTFRKLKDKDSDYVVRYAAGRALTQ